MKLTLTGESGGHPIRPLEVGEPDLVLVGTADDCRLRTRTATAEPYHAVIEVVPPAISIRSVGGAPVVVNQSAVVEAMLAVGDRVEMGETILTVDVSGAAQPRASVLNGVPSLPTATGAVVIRCGRCGEMARQEPTHTRAWNAAHICTSCREDLLADPVVPSDHRVRRRIWAGPVSALFEAEHVATGERRALEIYVPSVSGNKESAQAVVTAMLRHAALDHPRIPRVHGVFAVRPGILAISSEWVDSLDATHRRPPGATLDVAEVSEIAAAVLDTLSYAHGRGVIHRDLREADLLLDGQDDVRIANVGIAAILQLGGIRRLLASGDLMHVAPELLTDFRKSTAASDVYAAGAVLYQMLTGIQHLDTDARDPLVKILEGRTVPLSSRRPDLPEALGVVIERALYRDPARRFRTAAAMRAALQDALA